MNLSHLGIVIQIDPNPRYLSNELRISKFQVKIDVHNLFTKIIVFYHLPIKYIFKLLFNIIFNVKYQNMPIGMGKVKIFKHLKKYLMRNKLLHSVTAKIAKHI